MPIKIAIIGCGWVASSCHGPAIREYASTHASLTLGACVDLDAERAEQFRAAFGFEHAYTNYLEMLDNERPQAVLLNVPPPLTAEMGSAILERGYPLLCEKPPGLSLAEIDRLIDAAQSSHAIHQVAFNRRHMPLIAHLKQRLAQQTVINVDILLTRVYRTDPQFATTAVHAIDAARYLAGCDYQQAFLSAQELPGCGPGVANFELNAVFTSGATAHLSFLPLSGANHEQICVYCRDDAFILEAFIKAGSPGRLRQFHQGQLVLDTDAFQLTQRTEDYYLNGFYHQAATFFKAVESGVQPEHDFKSARQPVEIMAGIMNRRASEKG